MKVVGIVNTFGEYQGRKYHNLVIHVTYKETNENKDCKGLLTDVVKLRFSDVDSILGLGLPDPSDVDKLKAENFDYLIGAEIEVSYNKFGVVQSVKIVDSPKQNTSAPHAVQK